MRVPAPTELDGLIHRQPETLILITKTGAGVGLEEVKENLLVSVGHEVSAQLNNRLELRPVRFLIKVDLLECVCHKVCELHHIVGFFLLFSFLVLD